MDTTPLPDSIDPRHVVRRTVPAGLHSARARSPSGGPEAALALAAPAVRAAELRLRELVASEVSVVSTIGTYLAESGGKRLRPMLTVLGCGAVARLGDCSGLACVGELIHLGSLLHDDVVDGASLRRNRAAAHEVYGNAAVILTGDFCLARAVLLAATDGGQAAVTRLAEAVTAMAEGEVLQLQRAGNLETTLPQYMEMIDKKSAALIAWCASVGALTVGDTVAEAALTRFGRGVGIAFQITDDVLDYADGTGKDAGADLRERKLTLPLLHAMARVPTLRVRLEAREPDARAVAAFVEEIRGCGALESALAVARDRVDGALDALTVLAPSPYRDALADLGRHLVDRAA